MNAKYLSSILNQQAAGPGFSSQLPVQPWRGLIPGMGSQPVPQAPMQPFLASGPYGQQAMQMAGLLGGGMQIPQQPPVMQAQGLLNRPVKYQPPG